MNATSPNDAPAKGPSNLVLRTLSALVLIPVALAAVWFGDVWFAGLVAVVVLAAGAEWRGMAALERRGIGTLLLTAPLFVVVAAQAASAQAGLLVLAVALLIGLAAFGSPWGERRWALTALVHLGLPALALIWLRAAPDIGADLVFFLFVAVWLADIGGYAVGRTIGGPRLAPLVSPGKTWAGLSGALAFPAVGAFAFARWADIAAEPIVLVAIALALMAQAGDLFESWVKRRFGVKDSGASIPGHGGVLDRVDGVMFAAPAMVLVAMLIGTDFVQWR